MLAAAATKKTAAELDSTNPDLSQFHARGSKLIMYHGWDDPAISPWNTIAYYQSVQKTMGAEKTSRLCGSTWCPAWTLRRWTRSSAFGQLGIATTNGPKYGVFDALVDWVEKECSPGEVIATKYDAGQEGVMTRPLCPYPDCEVQRHRRYERCRQLCLQQGWRNEASPSC